jgi:hypothetical protein
VNLKGYRGSVQKSATVYSNDPKNPRLTLLVKGKIRPFIQVDPANTVSFRGLYNELDGRTIDVKSTSKPFQVIRVESNLDERISYKLEVIEEGKHYRLLVENRAKEGDYRGFIKIYTDLAEKPQVSIQVAAHIEGEIAVRPKAIVIGKLVNDQPVRSGKVLVISNVNKEFSLKKLIYDSDLMDVSQEPLSQQGMFGYTLEITPKIDHLPKGQNQRLESKLVIETDEGSMAKQEVKVYVVSQ